MSRTQRRAHINDQTLDQLVDMAVESVGGDPSNSDFTPALMKARDKWHDAVERELTKWVSKNIDKFDLDARPFSNLRDSDADDIVEVLLDLRGGAGYLYFMEMEGHGVGTWDGDWDQLFVDGGRGVKELSKHMERAVSREYRDLKNEIEDIAFASVPEDEDGYEDDIYSRNRYARRRASRSVTASDRKRLIRLASSLPVGSPERKAILNGLVKSAASDRSANYDREILALIHEERRVKHSWEREVSKAYSTLDNTGEGYGVGEETDGIDAIREAGRLIDTVDNGQIAVYWNPSHLTLVADKYGPWAVDVRASSLLLDIRGALGDLPI